MSGDKTIGPMEPWYEISQITKKRKHKKHLIGFCDDTWRFEDFSSEVCKHFTVCSTPEPEYTQKYKNIGYNNIILANWHANSNWFPKIDFKDKENNIAFIGTPNKLRNLFFNQTDLEIQYLSGLSQEQMFKSFCNTKIGINLSVNNNDPYLRTQMKQRIFEVPAGGGMLMTEYHKGIENFYKINKEIITFETPEEFKQKSEFFMKNQKACQSIANNGHKRFLAEHDSEIRLSKTIQEIMKI